jgi:hypothetical protein
MLRAGSKYKERRLMCKEITTMVILLAAFAEQVGSVFMYQVELSQPAKPARYCLVWITSVRESKYLRIIGFLTRNTRHG